MFFHSNSAMQNGCSQIKNISNPPARQERWFFGGLGSCLAVFVTHPLDTIKVHLQTHKGKPVGTFYTAKNLVKKHGFLSLYNGVSASLLRQMLYTGSRFALFNEMKQRFSPDGPPEFFVAVLMATAAGTIGGLIGTPTDLVNVRMQNDTKLPKEHRRNYKNVFDGLYTVVRNDGIRTLFRGGGMVCFRAVMMTVGQLAFYDNIKNKLIQTTYFQDRSNTHFLASLMTGAIATLLTQPIDVVKTRIMNAKSNEYKSILLITTDIIKDGPRGFFKGIVPSFIRIGSHTIIIFLTIEKLRKNFGFLPPSKLYQ